MNKNNNQEKNNEAFDSDVSFKIIGHIKSDFPEKFGIPRQSGLSPLASKIILKPEYRIKEAFRGLSGYSHIWILWHFSASKNKEWSPTVRPPKLGGNVRMGVFATRSPYRPNPIAISAVKLEKIDFDASNGPVLYVLGADIMDNTPIFDIKPYIPYADAYPGASSGFSVDQNAARLEVSVSQELKAKISQDKLEGLICVLSQDPRPGYLNSADSEKTYTLSFEKKQITFVVSDKGLEITAIED